MDRADAALDRFVDRVLNAVEEHTKGKTQKQILKALLKGKPRSRFCRPVLRGQLRDMSSWSKSLADCGVPDMAAMAGEAAVLHEVCEKAETLLADTKKASRTFRDIGARKQFIDGLNADRKEIDGALAKLPFQNPGLPPDFNEWFFLSEPPREDPEETIEDVQAAILELKTQLQARENQLTQMKQQADAEAEARKAAARTERDTKAADLRAEAQKLLDEAAKLDEPDDEDEDK